MKRILALVMLAVLVSANAFAQAVDQAGNKETATFGDQDANKNYRVSADTTGLVQFANDTSIAYPYENIANGTAIANAVSTITNNPGFGYFLSSTDSGLNIADYGGKTAGTAAIGTLTGSGTRYILPTCSASAVGFQFDLATAVRETITITPYSTADSIAYSISGTGLLAGQGIKNSGTAAAGDEAEITCSSVGNWTLHNIAGTWATST
jgi:hypothetical protein